MSLENSTTRTTIARRLTEQDARAQDTSLCMVIVQHTPYDDRLDALFFLAFGHDLCMSLFSPLTSSRLRVAV